MGISDSLSAQRFRCPIPYLENDNNQIYWQDVNQILNNQSYQMIDAQKLTYLMRVVHWNGIVLSHTDNSVLLRMNPQFSQSADLELIIPPNLSSVSAHLHLLTGHNIDFVGKIIGVQENLVTILFVNYDIYSRPRLTHFQLLLNILHSQKPLTLHQLFTDLKPLSWHEFLSDSLPNSFNEFFLQFSKYLISIPIIISKTEQISLSDKQNFFITNMSPKQRSGTFLVTGRLQGFEIKQNKLLIYVAQAGIEPISENWAVKTKNKLKISQEAIDKIWLYKSFGELQVKNLMTIIKECTGFEDAMVKKMVKKETFTQNQILNDIVESK
ncbi:Conserved_hypothetical protein [Hexamita inflata]|uniref:Uncharacterized protein n=1 Tax=Hexamita inflata TaxID=28002 RepID=A0AA86U597_9EUKA|nr:Conserved hypothetical protein [Hexamita inflata]